jgi:hypothetical protein
LAQEQSGIVQLIEGLLQLLLTALGHRRQKPLRELTTNHRGDLGHFFDGREAIQARHQSFSYCVSTATGRMIETVL